jgi:hypothetical protein
MDRSAGGSKRLGPGSGVADGISSQLVRNGIVVIELVESFQEIDLE